MWATTTIVILRSCGAIRHLILQHEGGLKTPPGFAQLALALAVEKAHS